MQFIGVVIASNMALMARAVPFHGHNHAQIHQNRQLGDFMIRVTNNCGSDKSFALYEVTPGFTMDQISDTRIIRRGKAEFFHAPFSSVGLRLSGNADWPIDDQWNPQGLVEFGHSEYSGHIGTAYDLSFMPGADPSIGISVTPDNSNCASKSCSPLTCSLSEAWTNSDQTADGSPADTVCYYGKTGFDVVWCPPS